MASDDALKERARVVAFIRRAADYHRAQTERPGPFPVDDEYALVRLEGLADALEAGAHLKLEEPDHG